MSHVPSKRPTANAFPSGAHCRPYTQSDSGNALISVRSLARNSFTVLSADEESRYWPSGDHANRKIASSCAINDVASLPLFSPRDQMQIFLSSPPAATNLPVGSTAIALIPSCGSDSVYNRSPVAAFQIL